MDSQAGFEEHANIAAVCVAQALSICNTQTATTRLVGEGCVRLEDIGIGSAPVAFFSAGDCLAAGEERGRQNGKCDDRVELQHHYRVKVKTRSSTR